MANGCPIGLVQTRQIGLLWRTQETPSATGCPIDFQQVSQLQFLPERRTHQSEEARKAVAPLAEEGAKAQQQVNQQSRPYLPAYGIGVVAEEVGQLERLLEFLEKDLDAPATAIQIGDGLGAPFQLLVRKTISRISPSTSTKPAFAAELAELFCRRGVQGLRQKSTVTLEVKCVGC